MKKQWFTRALAYMVILVMVFALASCSGGDKTPTQGGTASDKPEQSKSPDSSAPAEEELPFVTMDWYLGLIPMPDNQMVNDAVNEYLKEKVNANVNIHYWEAKDWETKMTTMISAGEDVGIVGFGSQSKLDYVVQSKRGSFYALNELLDTYGTETKALFPQEIWDSMSIDGSIYGIPSLKDNAYIISLVYNSEMADALGLDMSQVKYSNWRQLEPFLEEVVQKRHEKFPEYDEVPLVNDSSLEVPYNFALETFLNDSYLAVANIDPFNDVAGYDNDTIFNLYATDEYREFAKSRVRMVEKNILAYDYTGKDEWNYEGGMFGWVGWGYTYMQPHLYGDKFTTKMLVSDHIWTDTNNFFSAGTAISANAADPERAMMILNLVNTDPEFATMMRFGIEGEHYVKDANGKMTFEGSKRNGGERADFGYNYWYAAPVGNLTIVNAPEDYIGPDGILLTEMQRLNKEAVMPKHMGFVFDINPVANEIAACTNVVMEYRDTLRQGKLGSEAEVDTTVDEFNEKLTANGVDKIVAEAQKQVDAWKASK